MKEITRTYQIYRFDELSPEAQEKAISDHIEFEIETYGYWQGEKLEDNPIHDSVLKSERLQTPWFLGEIIYEDNKEYIIDTIRANQYGFFEDGSLIDLDMYPDDWADETGM